MVDAFAAIGVSATDLVAYLGHDLGKCSPAQIVTLRGIYGAIKDGEATWQSVAQNKSEQGQAPAAGDSGKQLEVCSAENFDKKKDGWRKTIIEGKKTVKELITVIETRELLTEEQKLTIDAWSHEND